MSEEIKKGAEPEPAAPIELSDQDLDQVAGGAATVVQSADKLKHIESMIKLAK